MRNLPKLILAGLTSGLLLTGCGSRETTTPTLADEMRGAAAEVQVEADRREQLADDWERGQNLIGSGQSKIERGESRISSAQRDLERGRREVEEGQAEISEGRRLVAASERRYEELRRQNIR